MTEEQIKFLFNHIYRTIRDNDGILFADLALKIKCSPTMFYAMLGQMERSGLIKCKSHRYFVGAPQ